MLLKVMFDIFKKTNGVGEKLTVLGIVSVQYGYNPSSGKMYSFVPSFATPIRLPHVVG